MNITTQKIDECIVFVVEGKIDASNAAEFETAFTKELSADAQKVIVDLSQLEYLSSAGLRSLLLLAKSVQKTGGSSVLCGINGIVEEVLKISGFLNIFKNFATVEEAMKA